MVSDRYRTAIIIAEKLAVLAVIHNRPCITGVRFMFGPSDER
jgi:hypothetical protein